MLRKASLMISSTGSVASIFAMASAASLWLYPSETSAAQGAGQAISALVSLGHSQSEAALAVSKIDASLPVEEIIKLALRGMAGRR